MKITEVEEFALSFKRENAPRRGVGQPIKKDTVIVRVKTEDGIVGYGEAHHALAPTLVADLVNQNLSALIVLGVMLFAPAVQLAAAGQVRLLAVSSPQRLAGALADVPTWREQGYDAVVSQWRGVVGPKGMSEAQVAYWERTLKRMTEADEWKQDIEKNFWSAEFMNAQQMRQFMDRDNVALKRFLGELGLVK